MTGPEQFETGGPALRLALTVRFLLELALLAGAGAASWSLAPGAWRLPAAVAAVLVVGTLWGRLLSPRAPVAMPPALRLAVESVLVITVAVLLWAAAVRVPAIVGLALWAADRIAITLLGRPAERDG